MSENTTQVIDDEKQKAIAIFAHNYNILNDKIINKEYFNKLSIDELYLLLDEAKSVQSEYRNLEITIKKDGNSIYGVMGNKHFPLVDYECAEDTTNAGKHYTVLIDHHINFFHRDWGEKELKVIQEFYPNVTHLRKFTEYKPDTINDMCVYGDTDSRYVHLKKVYDLIYVNEHNNLFPDTSTNAGRKELSDFSVFLVKNFYNKLIEDTLNKDLEFRNARKGYLKMAHEVTSIKSIFRAKKNYILPIIWQDGKYLNGEIKFKSIGVEIKKGGLDATTKKFIERLLNFFLLENKSNDFIRIECLKIIKYLREKGQKRLVSRIVSVKNLHNIYYDETDRIYKSEANHQSMKVALSWYNYIHKNRLNDVYKPPFNGQKMYFYYTTTGDVFGIPDDVNMETVPNAPTPDYVRMVKEIIVKSIYTYINTKPIGTKIKISDVDNFIAGVKTLKDI